MSDPDCCNIDLVDTGSISVVLGASHLPVIDSGWAARAVSFTFPDHLFVPDGTKVGYIPGPGLLGGSRKPKLDMSNIAESHLYPGFLTYRHSGHNLRCRDREGFMSLRRSRLYSAN